MIKHHLRTLGILSCLSAGTGALALDWTGATVFLTNESGEQNAVGRWNSGPVDGAWDLFFFEGDPLRSPPQDGARWINAEGDHSLKVPLAPGRTTWTFHFESTGSLPLLGVNLFFGGRNDKPAISAFVPVAGKGPPWPEPKPNGARVTMALPILDVPGSGSLEYLPGEGGLWTRADDGNLLRVALRELRILEPALAGNLDLVGPHSVGPSGRPDHVGTLTLEVERCTPRPQALPLWLQTRAGVTLGERDRSASWLAAHEAAGIPAPFSFVYGGASSRTFLDRWRVKRSVKVLDSSRTAVTIEYVDPETSLSVRWEGVEYREPGTIEWTVYFKNQGSAESPILSDVLALDLGISRRAGQEFLLRHWKGTFVRPDDFEPLSTTLEPEKRLRFAPPGGRPCGHVFPYYNLEAEGEGLIIVVSWAGQWAAEFQREGERGLAVKAGQEGTHFKLRAGEEVRTPLIVVQPWAGGDWIDAQNAWRRWMLRFNLPRPGGKLPPFGQLAACSSHQFAEMIHANEANQKLFVDRYVEEGLGLDYWWMDAGWYVNDWGWPNTGTWEVDRKRFPNGLRAISDHARTKGIRTIVWFEPERVTADTWLTREHPEWILGGAGGGLLDLGNPAALRWLTDHVDGIIKAEGIDLYRQDYNIDPLGHWRGNDAPDRRGITENHYVQGYFAYWDELLRRHPDMLIDSCASGGHRNDLETMRRSVPLLRSDYLFDPTGQQGHTYGLSFWLPFHGTAFSSAGVYDPYSVRSQFCPHNTCCFDVRDPKLDYSLIRRLRAERLEVVAHSLGDFYPLTPYDLGSGTWMAWQYHDPAKGEGAVQAFRRGTSSFYGAELRLRGLDPEANYEVRNFDAEGPRVMTGAALMRDGLRVDIQSRPGAASIVYKKV